MMKGRFIAAIISAAVLSVPLSAGPIDGTFNYQARLTSGGVPITGVVDARFSLWDAAAAGSQVGANIEFLGAAVTDGLYNADLDFGVAALNGDMRWLQVEVRSPAGVGAYALLGRREILGAPYAIQTRGLFVDSLLNVGIGTTTPTSLLDVRDDATGQGFRYHPGGVLYTDLTLYSHLGERVLYHVPFDGLSSSASQMSFFDGNGDRSLDLGSALPDGDGLLNIWGEGGAFNFQIRGNPDAVADGVSNTRMFIRSSGVGGVGGEISVLNNDSAETIQLLGGTSGSAGSFSMFNNVGAPIFDVSLLDSAGQVRIIDGVTGQNLFWALEDASFGGGGYLLLAKNDNGDAGVTIQGNYAGTESPSLSLSGTSSVFFNTSTTGSDTAVLPTDAIESTEILDEPGVASAVGGGNIFLSGGYDTLLSRTINCPTSGYCVVIATCQAQVSHVTGTDTAANFGVSDAAGSFPNNQDVGITYGNTAPSAFYVAPVTVHGTFSVAAGNNTFYSVGKEETGAWLVYDMQLTVMFFPTAYGTVTPTILSRQGDDANAIQMLPMSGIDIQNEQIQAAVFDQNRRDTEAADFAQQVAAMQAQLDQMQREQEALRTELRRGSPPPTNTGVVARALGHDPVTRGQAIQK